MRTPNRLAIALSLSLSVLIGTPAGPSQAVLCLGTDGHLAIEVGESRCASYETQGTGAVELTGAQDCCGDCVDVPMKRGVSAAHGRSRVPDSAPSGTAPAPSVVGFELPAWTLKAFPAPVANSHACFAPSRTTILRN